MYKKTVIFLLLFICLSTTAVFSDQWHTLADEYMENANQLFSQEKYSEAAQMYMKSVETEKKSSRMRTSVILKGISEAANSYNKLELFTEALNCYNKLYEFYFETEEEDIFI